jgi:ParB family chromosome partitioning protein
VSRRSGLGKGLSSLIPQAEPTNVDEAAGPLFVELPIGDIAPNPHQPRVHFDEDALGELAASIAQVGVLQPVLVRPAGGRYELIAGERRWRAAQRAGLTTVPAVVRTTDDASSVEHALVENLHRQDLTPLEEAAAYQQLIEDFGLTHDDVARRVGKSRSTITNALRLLGLPPAVQHLLADGKLSAGHARALLGTPDRSLQERLARSAAAEGWSVRTTEDAVRHGGAVPVPAASSPTVPGRGPGAIDGAGLTPATRLRPPGLLELEQLLADQLDTRVGVQMGAKRGKVTIEFADLADLERIYRRIAGDA